MARCRGTLRESPGLCSPKWAVPPRLSCTCEVRPELLLLRERCCHHTERACDAPRLVRVDRAWCTPTSSVHKAACTIPVVECSQGPFECSVISSYSKLATNTNDTLTYQSERNPHVPTTTHSLARDMTTTRHLQRPIHAKRKVQAKQKARRESS